MSDPSVRKMNEDTNAIFQEVQEFMEADIHYYIRHRSFSMERKEVLDGNIAWVTKEDWFHTIVLKLILLSECIKTCMILTNETCIYFTYATLRSMFEVLLETRLLLKSSQADPVLKQKQDALIKYFHYPGEIIDGKFEWRPKKGNPGLKPGKIRSALGDPDEANRGMYDVLSKFVHNNAHTIVGHLAGQENEDGGYTFGALSKKNPELAHLTKRVWEAIYASLLLFNMVRIEIDGGVNSEYQAKSEDLLRRFREVSTTYNLWSVKDPV